MITKNAQPEMQHTAKVVADSAHEKLAKPNKSKLEKLFNKGIEKEVNPLVKLHAKHGGSIDEAINIGNKASLAANVASLGEPLCEPLGATGTVATRANLFSTGAQGTIKGLVELKDLVYSAGRFSDLLVSLLPVPKELLFAIRVGPSLYNLSVATRQINKIATYDDYSDSLRANGKQLQDYIRYQIKNGLFSGYKIENADESKEYSVGGPLKSFLGSAAKAFELSSIPIPDKAKLVLKTIAYPLRLTGAMQIDFAEATSKEPQSKYSGASKVDFFLGAASDFLNKFMKYVKVIAGEHLGFDENSKIMKLLDYSETFFKNLTPTLESMGRVVSSTATEKGLTNPEYKVKGLKGILGEYFSSHLDSIFSLGKSDSKPGKSIVKGSRNLKIPGLAELKAKKAQELKAAKLAKAVTAKKVDLNIKSYLTNAYERESGKQLSRFDLVSRQHGIKAPVEERGDRISTHSTAPDLKEIDNYIEERSILVPIDVNSEYQNDFKTQESTTSLSENKYNNNEDIDKENVISSESTETIIKSID